MAEKVTVEFICSYKVEIELEDDYEDFDDRVEAIVDRASDRFRNEEDFYDKFKIRKVIREGWVNTDLFVPRLGSDKFE